MGLGIFEKLSVPAIVLLGAGCVSAPPPDSVVGDYLSARIAAYENDIESAADKFSKARAKAPGSPEIRRNTFYFHLAAGEIDEALYLAEVLAADPNAGDGGFAKATLAVRALKKGNYGTANRLIKESGDEGFPRPAANLISIWAMAAIDGEQAALDKLRSIPGDEYRGFYPLHAALLSENLGDADEARSAYQLSVMAFSGSAEIAAYGNFLEREGEDDGAREYYELLASQDGFGRYAGRAGLARLDRVSNVGRAPNTTPQEGGALALYSLASGVLQDTWRRRDAAEKAGFRVGQADYNLSLAMSQLALYLDPGLDDARRFAGSILNYYEEYNGAIEMLSGVSARSPYYEQAQIEIAGAYRNMGDLYAAVSTLKDVIASTGYALDAELSLAGIYAQEDRHGDAVKLLDKLIDALPVDPNRSAWRLFLSRGASLIEMDEWERAEADLRRAVDLAPDEATTLNYLGYSWAERGENLDEAFELIEKAVAIEPGSGAIIDSLGWAHYQRGNYDIAVSHLEQAASLEPGDTTITDHLGDVYWRLGRRLEARYQWQRVLELEPELDLAETVRQKIKSGLPQDESASD